LKQVTARPADLRLIPSCCYAFCWLAICTASAASASWWKNCACIWHGAGSRVWVPIRRFRITPRSRRTVIGGFRNRNCSRILSHAGIFQSLRGLIHRATSALAVLVLSSKSYSCIWEWSVIEFQSAQLESLRVRVNEFTRRHHIELTTPGAIRTSFPSSRHSWDKGSSNLFDSSDHCSLSLVPKSDQVPRLIRCTVGS
jgi:hypothetical protein